MNERMSLVSLKSNFDNIEVISKPVPKYGDKLEHVLQMTRQSKYRASARVDVPLGVSLHPLIKETLPTLATNINTPVDQPREVSPSVKNNKDESVSLERDDIRKSEITKALGRDAVSSNAKVVKLRSLAGTSSSAKRKEPTAILNKNSDIKADFDAVSIPVNTVTESFHYDVIDDMSTEPLPVDDFSEDMDELDSIYGELPPEFDDEDTISLDELEQLEPIQISEVALESAMAMSAMITDAPSLQKAASGSTSRSEKSRSHERARLSRSARLIGNYALKASMLLAPVAIAFGVSSAFGGSHTETTTVAFDAAATSITGDMSATGSSAITTLESHEGAVAQNAMNTGPMAPQFIIEAAPVQAAAIAQPAPAPAPVVEAAPAPAPVASTVAEHISKPAPAPKKKRSNNQKSSSAGSTSGKKSGDSSEKHKSPSSQRKVFTFATGGATDDSSDMLVQRLIDTQNIDPTKTQIIPTVSPKDMAPFAGGPLSTDQSVAITAQTLEANVRAVLASDPDAEIHFSNFSQGNMAGNLVAKKLIDEGIPVKVTAYGNPESAIGMQNKSSAANPIVKPILDNLGIVEIPDVPETENNFDGDDAWATTAGDGGIESFLKFIKIPENHIVVDKRNPPIQTFRIGTETFNNYGKKLIAIPPNATDITGPQGPEFHKFRPEAAANNVGVAPGQTIPLLPNNPTDLPSLTSTLINAPNPDVQPAAPTPESAKSQAPSFFGEQPCVAADGSQYFTPGNAPC